MFDDVRFKGKGHEVSADTSHINTVKCHRQLWSRSYWLYFLTQYAFRQLFRLCVCVCFVPSGWGPAAADAEDGELGSQAVSKTTVWGFHWPSGEAWQEERSAGVQMLMLNMLMIYMNVLIFGFYCAVFVMICLFSCGRLVSNGYDWTCHWHTKIIWVKTVREKNMCKGKDACRIQSWTEKKITGLKIKTCW